MAPPPEPPDDAISPLRRAASELLARELGDGGSARDVAAGAVRTCDRLSGYFARLVGEQGTRALLGRSLATASRTFPWLAAAAAAPPETRSTQLAASLEAQPRDVALAGASQLVTGFVEILGRMIGDALVLRLLRDIEPHAPPTSDEETP